MKANWLLLNYNAVKKYSFKKIYRNILYRYKNYFFLAIQIKTFNLQHVCYTNSYPF